MKHLHNRPRDWRALRRRVAHCTAWWVVWGALFSCAVAPATSAADAADGDKATVHVAWPRWRGPLGDAVLEHVELAKDWPSGPLRSLWHARLGTGWSSPVVAGGRVFITDREGAAERVRAYDATTGQELWTRAHEVDFDPHSVGRRHGNGPKGTPLADGDRVYAVGIAGRLQCLAVSNGEVRWEVNFPAEFGVPEPLAGDKARVVGTDHVLVPIGRGQGAAVPLFGYTGSPTLEGDLLITSVGGRRAGTIVAFDKNSGRVVWKSLQENVSYSSPIMADVAGVRQVIVMTGPRVVGLALTDGALLWGYPFQIQFDESISTPAVAGDLVLFTATGRPLTALRIRPRAGGLSATPAWTNDLLSSYLSSMVVGGEYLYGMNDGGEFCCVRLADGKTMWSGGNHGYYSSPIRAGDRLFALNERGRLAVLAADPSAFKLLAENQLVDGETWTMPAIVGERIYVRSTDALSCITVRAAGSK